MPRKKKTISRVARNIVISSILGLLPSNSFAGKLDDFEKDAQTPRPETECKTYGDSDDTDTLDEFIGELFVETIGLAIFAGSRSSYSRMNGVDPETPPRVSGEPTIPFFRSDLTYQEVESDVNATDLRVEVGYAAFGFQFRTTHYQESAPDDELDAYQYLGLLRFSSSRKWEIDLGLGALTLDGNERTSGFSLSLPIQFFPRKNIGLRFRPSWSWLNGNTIDDYDLGIMLAFDYFALQAGYRWFKGVSQSLNGPYLGFSGYY